MMKSQQNEGKICSKVPEKFAVFSFIKFGLFCLRFSAAKIGFPFADCFTVENVILAVPCLENSDPSYVVGLL